MNRSLSNLIVSFTVALSGSLALAQDNLSISTDGLDAPAATRICNDVNTGSVLLLSQADTQCCGECVIGETGKPGCYVDGAEGPDCKACQD